MTSSVSPTHLGSLWEALSHNLLPDSWRVVINSQNVIASIHTLKDSTGQKIVYQRVLSTVFKAVSSNENQDISQDVNVNQTGKQNFLMLILIDIIPIMTENTLKGMIKKDLLAICKKYNIKQGK